MALVVAAEEEEGEEPAAGARWGLAQAIAAGYSSYHLIILIVLIHDLGFCHHTAVAAAGTGGLGCYLFEQC